jgi:GNAT superfamily N-acetyltransferase
MESEMRRTHQSIGVGPLRESELEEADRIVRVAFGSFLGLPNPLEFMGDRDFLTPRWRARNTVVLAARQRGTLLGSNVITRWGSVGFFGPLTVSPDYWDRGVAQLLLSATMKIFSRWGVAHSGLLTFSNSPRHIGLYQKFGYWPGTLTALMKYTPQAPASAFAKDARMPVLLSALSQREMRRAIDGCAKLANGIEKGLDLSDEIRAVLAQRLGDTLLVHGARTLDAFAVCMNGAGSEGGVRTCYVKFAAARGGRGSGERFDRLLDAIDAFASTRNAEVETGVSLACEDACRRMRSHGFRMITLGVAMHSPHGKTYNRSGAYILGDWR